MAAEIKKELGCEADLIKGGKGIFDVKCDDTLLFSKHASGRFPENPEVLESIRRIENKAN